MDGKRSEAELFVGREWELSALRLGFEEARAQHPRIALIEGEAGIGKTALVRRFLRETKVRILRASADEAEGAVAYGVVSQLVVSLGPSSLQDAPALRSGPAPSFDPLVIGAELAASLVSEQESGPLILVVEDLHWVDLASSEALLLMCRRLRAHRLLVLVTYRPRSLARLGGRWEHLATSDDRCLRVSLSGLDASAIRALAAGMGRGNISRTVAQRIVAHTEGNTLHVRALLQELNLDSLGGGDEPLPAPRSLADVVLDRLRALPDEARHLTVAAAVLGRSCPLTLAARLASVEDPVESLDAAQGADILAEIPGSGGRKIAFVHPLVHAAVYGDIGPARRRSLHRAAAKLLEGRNSLAHRVAAAIGPDSGLADSLEAAAQREAAVGHFSSAALHCHQASELSEDRLVAEQRLIRTADFMLRGGDVVGAANLSPAIQRFGVSAAREEVLGRLAFLSGQGADAERLLRAAWELRSTEDWESATLILCLSAGTR